MDCEEYHRVAFDRTHRSLEFGPSSGVFVGNAGGTGLPKFVVSPQQLLRLHSHHEPLTTSPLLLHRNIEVFCFTGGDVQDHTMSSKRIILDESPVREKL